LCASTNIYYGDEGKEDEMGRTCSRRWRDVKGI